MHFESVSEGLSAENCRSLLCFVVKQKKKKKAKKLWWWYWWLLLHHYFIYSFGYLICHAPVADKEVDFAHFKVAQSVLLCLASLLFLSASSSAPLTLSFFFSLAAAAATMWNGLWSRRRADGCCLINYRRSLIHLSCSTYYYYYDPLSSSSSSLFEVALFVSHNWLLSPCFAKSWAEKRGGHLQCSAHVRCCFFCCIANQIKHALLDSALFGAGGPGSLGL